MAPRSAPTARRLRLGAELRKLRERAGITAAEAARTLGTTQAQISNIEANRFGVSAERVRTLASIYSCPDQSLIDALAAMAADRTRGWWEEYREILPTGLLDLAELEHHAVTLRTAYTAHMPGLLQSSDHAREIIQSAVPPLSPPEVEHRLSHRIKRQTVLYRDGPTPFHTIVHEAALRMKFGGPAVARRQLQHLLDMSEHDHITIQVISFDAGTYPGSGQSVCYAEGPVPQLDTVQLDQSHGSALLDAEHQLSKYRTLLDRLEATALRPAKSRDFIHTIARHL
ncbi:helix-turn-helix transcriptional regulator [Streptomyces sp. A3M-1-3]|uniref:helix-turn-helix domain-containing protein n=1 Tax=Streptomyces sp. A3M-1-3 TaxID=2962044 RepID=UPI0020B8EB18|nr:helix-turn-helix transcriptional regulator [Streptomyces sp. A3M-1-3]MCP3819962.1 helix-turn-helix transcriptional regulator [Streptomyces sp. A3M-1-3]